MQLAQTIGLEPSFGGIAQYSDAQCNRCTMQVLLVDRSRTFPNSIYFLWGNPGKPIYKCMLSHCQINLPEGIYIYIHKMEHADQKRYKIWRYVHIGICSVDLSILWLINVFGHYCCNNQQTAMRDCCPMIGRRCHIVCLGYPCWLPIPPSMSSESVYPMIYCIHVYSIHSCVCSLFPPHKPMIYNCNACSWISMLVHEQFFNYRYTIIVDYQGYQPRIIKWH